MRQRTANVIALHGHSIKSEYRSPRRIFCTKDQVYFVHHIINHVTILIKPETLQLEYDQHGYTANLTDTEYKEINALFGNLWESYKLNIAVCTQAFLKRTGITNCFEESGIIVDGWTPEFAAPLINNMVKCIDTSYISNPYNY